MQRRQLLLLTAAWAGAGAFSSSVWSAPTLDMLCGTTLITDIVTDLLGDNVRTLTLAGSSRCPVHTDLKVADVLFCAKAQVALLHDFQRALPSYVNLVKAAQNEHLNTIFLSVHGNWMSPPVQKKASQDIAQLLITFAPHQAEQIRKRLSARLAKIDALHTRLAAQWAQLKGRPVVAAFRQANFLQWAGLDVVQTYQTADDVSAKALVQLVRTLKDRRIQAVVDNQQSGAQMGAALARELGVAHVTLSNFPSLEGERGDWFSLLEDNVAALCAALP